MLMLLGPCCDETPIPDETCENCTDGSVPTSVEVILAGFQFGDAPLNGTWTLTPDGQNDCQYAGGPFGEMLFEFFDAVGLSGNTTFLFDTDAAGFEWEYVPAPVPADCSSYTTHTAMTWIGAGPNPGVPGTATVTFKVTP